jgi:hypothetical protein
MQLEEIIGLINAQIPFDNGTLSRLSGVIEEYPYFQAAHLLYTLNLQAEKDTRMLAEIRKTACYVGDRKKLFYLIEKDFLILLRSETEKEESRAISDSPFDLIDLFLAGKGAEMKNEFSIPVADSQLASTDYMSYFFSKETQNQTLNVEPMRHQDAIDRFISEDEKSGVKIILKDKGTKGEELLPDIDKEIGNRFFSETLAKIYLKQKKYTKALEIIIKLSLVYPEKNAYFADQIRFLEKLVINIPK